MNQPSFYEMPTFFIEISPIINARINFRRLPGKKVS